MEPLIITFSKNRIYNEIDCRHPGGCCQVGPGYSKLSENGNYFFCEWKPSRNYQLLISRSTREGKEERKEKQGRLNGETGGQRMEVEESDSERGVREEMSEK